MTIRLGIIGAGIMGERLLRAMPGQDAAALSAIWDPDAAALARLGEAPAAASAAAVIEASDCVYVASPPSSHLGHARAVLAAGRALFCEKPLAADMADATTFMAEAQGARGAVNFPFASSPAVARLGAWLAEGAVGEVADVAITVAFATWPRGWQHAAAGWLDGSAQGGFTREVVSHFLFLARRLFGPLLLEDSEALFPEAGRSEREVSARLTAGGIPVSLAGGVGRTAADDENGFTITGAAGSIRLRDWAFAERLVDGAWQADPDAIPHVEARPLVLRRQLAGVAQMTAGQPHALATLAEAFEVQTVVEAILAG